MPDTVRVVVPDHVDLVGVVNRAIEFGVDLRHANDSHGGAVEPWQLPDQLIDPDLESALATIVAGWQYDVGLDTTGRDTAIPVHHNGTEHMGIYVATATVTQLRLLTDAAQLLHQAETTPPAQRTPALREVAEFLEVWGDLDDNDDADASLSAWRTVVRILGLAIATAPSGPDDRPTRLYTSEGTDARMLPTAPAEGTSPAADTARVLARLDTGDGRSIDLDDAAWQAWQRLTAEWHGAVYGARSDTHDALLNSWAY